MGTWCFVRRARDAQDRLLSLINRFVLRRQWLSDRHPYQQSLTQERGCLRNSCFYSTVEVLQHLNQHSVRIVLPLYSLLRLLSGQPFFLNRKSLNLELLQRLRELKILRLLVYRSRVIRVLQTKAISPCLKTPKTNVGPKD